MTKEPHKEFVKRLLSEPYDPKWEHTLIIRTEDRNDACDRIEQLEKDAKRWGKDQIFHYCKEGKIRPYLSAFCSCCTPRIKDIEKRDFNAFEKVGQLQYDLETEEKAHETTRGEWQKQKVKIKRLMRTLHRECPEKYPDNCEICKGTNSGVRGNENIIAGKVMCDYCHIEAEEILPNDTLKEGNENG